MSEPLLFPYLTPLLFPLFPVSEGTITIGLNVQKILDSRTKEPFTGELLVETNVFRDGKHADGGKKAISVRGGQSDIDTDWSQYRLGATGFVEIALSAGEAIFRRIDLPVGYGIMRVPGYGTVTVIPDAKFARPIIIEQMQTVSRFCLTRSGCRWHNASGSGESIFLVNPYEKDIVATLFASASQKLRHKVPSKHAVMISLQPLLTDGQWSCVMLTGNNRIPAWDIRHAADNPAVINSVDHLDVFRGSPTHEQVGVVQYAKQQTRRAMRRFGHVY